MKKILLFILVILLIPLCSCTVRESAQPKIDIDDLCTFIKTQTYAHGVYDVLSEKYSAVVYYVGEKGLGRPSLEIEPQVSSQRTIIFNLVDGTSVYLIAGEILGDVSIPQDIITEFTQTGIAGVPGSYVNNTVFAFGNILISSISNHRGKAG